MNSPAKVATLLCFCSSSQSPWQTGWIQSSCLQTKPLLLPGVSRVCQMLGCQLKTLPSWPPVSVGGSLLTHSNRASNGFGAGSAQIWGWRSWDRVWNYILRGTKYVREHVCLCALLPQELSWYDGTTVPKKVSQKRSTPPSGASPGQEYY